MDRYFYYLGHMELFTTLTMDHAQSKTMPICKELPFIELTQLYDAVVLLKFIVTDCGSRL